MEAILVHVQVHVVVLQLVHHFLLCHALDARSGLEVRAGYEFDLCEMVAFLSVLEKTRLGSAWIHAHHGAAFKLGTHRVNHKSGLVDVVSAVVQRVYLLIVVSSGLGQEGPHFGW